MYRTIGFIVLAGVLAGCAENNPPAENRQEKAANAAPADADASETKTHAKAADTGLTIPAGAQWTIYCQTVSGPNHVLRGKQVKENLIQTSGMRDWYLLHGETETTIYYGFYKSASQSDPDGKRAHAELAQLDALTDGEGKRPFQYAIIVPLSAPDPLAPPEWNLENAPAEKFWSLQIAAYKDSPDRKLAAVESVKAARAQGIEAYYYHSDNVSHVCIGAWPREAVKSQESDVAEGDSSKPLFVLPPGLSDDAARNLRLPDDQQATRVSPKVEVVDPSLQAAMRQYPEHAVNAEVKQVKSRDPHTGQVLLVPEPSLLVVIPRRAPSILAGDGTPVEPSPGQALPDAGTGVETSAKPAPKPSMTKGLKSIGE